MPRPKRIEIPEEPTETETETEATNERIVPAIVVENRSVMGVPVTRRYPRVLGGQCEFCGVIDSRYPATDQYKMCKHYKGISLKCSYCDSTKNPVEVIGAHRLNVAEHPDKPNTLVVWCGNYSCRQKHLKRFSPSGE